MLQSYNISVINNGMDSQRTSLRKNTAICVSTTTFKMKLAYTQFHLQGRTFLTHKINFAKHNLLQDIQLQIEQLSTLDTKPAQKCDIQQTY